MLDRYLGPGELPTDIQSSDAEMSFFAALSNASDLFKTDGSAQYGCSILFSRSSRTVFS